MDEATSESVPFSSPILELKNVANIMVYKVVAGTDEMPTLTSYNQSILSSGNRFGQNDDWRGLYTQFQSDHTLGTVPYRWERGHTKARLVEVTFVDRLNVVVLDGPLWHDTNLSGEMKAAHAKRQLGIPQNQSFLEALGDSGKVAMVRETADEWELIIPHQLLPKLVFDERGVAVFVRHPRLPITQQWRPENEDNFFPWNEGADESTIRKVIPNLKIPAYADQNPAETASCLELRADLLPGGEQALVHRGNPDEVFDSIVSRIQVQGNDTANGHQEIRLLFKQHENGGDHAMQPRMARISRTNGLDEVEVARDFEALPEVMCDYTFSEIEAITFGQVYDSFLRARDLIIRYDHGNCIVLTRKIMAEVAPNAGFGCTDAEEAAEFGFFSENDWLGCITCRYHN